ncbi:MAG: DUF1761 domain-containing protein [Flavobacteriales bacterium]|jgi:hypothetical protein|nr:DUF1761 domain-containing protein [Flavobacteriales bacterium]
MNLPVLLGAALIPTIVGFLYYNPKFGFGKAWMSASGVTEDMAKTGNMAIIFGVSLLLSVLLAVQVNFIVIHQAHIQSALMNQPGFGEEGSEVMLYLADFMAKYGQEFRTFKHGALHGVLSGVFFVLPVLGTNALFERKGLKYIAVNVGYWVITLALMGGVICQFA